MLHQDAPGFKEQNIHLKVAKTDEGIYLFHLISLEVGPGLLLNMSSRTQIFIYFSSATSVHP